MTNINNTTDSGKNQISTTIVSNNSIESIQCTVGNQATFEKLTASIYETGRASDGKGVQS